MVLTLSRFRTKPTKPPKKWSYTHAYFDDLSEEIKASILCLLPVADLQAARLSCLLAPKSTASDLISDVFAQRAEALREIHDHALFQARRSPGVAEFSRLRKLTLRLPPLGLHPGIVLLSQLRVLDISLRSGQSIMIDTLPEELGDCRELWEFRARRHAFSHVPCILLRMPGLRVVDLEDCAQIMDIPLEIGGKLPRLRQFVIAGTGVQLLPRSLLRTIDNNCVRSSSPLVLTPTSFPVGYLRSRITRKRYPVLAPKCEAMFEENDEELGGEMMVDGGNVGVDTGMTGVNE